MAEKLGTIAGHFVIVPIEDGETAERVSAAIASLPALIEAAKPIVDRLWEAEEEAHNALQVGGYSPTDDEDGLVITLGQARALRDSINRMGGE